MRGYSLSRLRADRTVFSALLESFVFSELLKLSAWTEDRVMLFHYRDRDQLEVDLIDLTRQSIACCQLDFAQVARSGSKVATIASSCTVMRFASIAIH
jgi:predicted AAA+ superfamily ATPase